MKRISKSLLLNLTLTFAASLITLYFLEAFLLFSGIPTNWHFPFYLSARKQGIQFDSRTPLQVVQQMRADGLEAYPYVYPKGFVDSMPETDDGSPIYALGGISHVNTVVCNETGTYMIYRSDRFGFHNPDDLWDEETVDIVALGDSFTLGTCVKSEENYVSRIRETVPKTLNLGMSGTGPLEALAALKEYGVKRKPKQVLWFYFEGNDISDLSVGRTNTILPRYVEPAFSQNLESRQDVVNTVREGYIKGTLTTFPRKELSRKLASLRLTKIRSLFKTIFDFQLTFADLADSVGINQSKNSIRNNATDKPIVNISSDEVVTCDHTYSKPTEPRAIITKIPTDHVDPLQSIDINNLITIADAMAQVVASWGGELTVVYLPDYGRFRNGQTNLDYTYRPCVLKAFAVLDIEMLDLLPVFTDHPDPLSLYALRQWGHLSVAGNELVAETILSHLESTQVVQPIK